LNAPDRIEVAAVRAFFLEGRRVEVGEVVELPLAEALAIIGIGRAEAAGAAARHVRCRASAQWSEAEPETERRARWDVHNRVAA
jgi:hypothetical protein